MPIDKATPAVRALRERRVLRLAAGTSLALCLSQSVGWTLSYIAPVLTLIVLALPVSRPPIKFFITIIIALMGSVYGAFILLPMLLHQRGAGLIMVALALFHSFYLTARGKPAVVGTLITVGVTTTIAVGSVSVDALLAVASGIGYGAIVGISIAWLMHVILPDTDVPAISAAANQETDGSPARNAVQSALRSLCVVLPVAVWFLYSSASASNVAVMIKVAAMGQEASISGTRNAARSLLISTFAGGVAAVVAWQVLAIWPSLIMYTLAVAIASLYFAGKIFQGLGLAPDGDTWSYALLTMVVILAPAALDSQFGNAANVSFYSRLWMLMGASLYGIGAVFLFDVFWPPAEQRRLLVEENQQ